MLEDKRLIRELKHGDKQALRMIYMEYKDNLLTIAAYLLHVVSEALSFGAVCGAI